MLDLQAYMIEKLLTFLKFLNSSLCFSTIPTIFLYSSFKKFHIVSGFELLSLAGFHFSPPCFTLICSHLHFPKATTAVLLLSSLVTFFICFLTHCVAKIKNNHLQSFDLCVIVTQKEVFRDYGNSHLSKALYTTFLKKNQFLFFLQNKNQVFQSLL